MFTILSRAIGFLLIIYLGYFLKQRKVFKHEDGAKLSTLLMNVTLPCSILASAAPIPFSFDLLLPFLMGIVGNLILDGFGYYFEKSHQPFKKGIALIQNSGFNIGTFVIPFVIAFFPSKYMMTVLLFDTGNSIMCIRGNYLLAERIIQGKQKQSIKAILKKIVASIPLCTYLMTLTVSLLQIQVPHLFLNIVSIAGNANPFVAMLMIGVLVDFHIDRQDVRLLIKRLLQRFVLMGILAGFVYSTFPISLVARKMLVLCLLAPISTLGPVYALQLGSTRSESANLNSLSIFISLLMLTFLSMCFA